MQPPGPPHPFRGAQYDKDMFTFLPSGLNRDVSPESSRKRKLISFDCQTNVPSSGSDSQGKGTLNSNPPLRSSESSSFRGYPEVILNLREVNGYGNREPNSNSDGVAQKRPNCPPLVTEDISWFKNHDSIAHVATPKPSDWHPPVNQGSYHHEKRESNFPSSTNEDSFQHGKCDSNTHVMTQKTSNGQPPLTQDVTQESYSRAIASTATTTQCYNPNDVGSRAIPSDLYERASSILAELQKVNVLNPRALSGVLGQKGRLEEETHKIDINKISGTNNGTSLHNLQTETNNLLNVLRLLSAASGIPIPENNDGRSQDSQHDVKFEDGQCLGSLAENVEKGSVKVNGACKMDDKKLWDGTLKLSTSVSVSAIAYFKSGEKMQDLTWSDSVEVKGKVRLEAFEKYVQDLPRSRSRGLMVISLCWKEGSSNMGHKSMKEVAKKYKDQKKVGFAKLSTDVDLYICPYSDTIITIIIKNGFCKDLTYIEDQNVPLIGCVVWKKNSSSRSKHAEVQTGEKEETSTQSEEINNKKEKTPEIFPSPRDFQTGKSPVSQNGSTSEFKNDVVLNKPVLPIPSVSSEKTSVDDDDDDKDDDPDDHDDDDHDHDDDDDDDLPEYDFRAALSQALIRKTSTIEAPIPNSEGPGLKSLDQKFEVKIPSLPVQEHKPIEKGVESSKKRNLFDDDDDDMPEWCPPDFGKKREEVTKRVEPSNSPNHLNVSTPGFADLTSGVMLPPPPPPPPLIKFQIQGQNRPSAPHVLPPPLKLERNSNPNPFVNLSNVIGFKPETTSSMSTQFPFKDGNYPSAPRVPPPQVAPRVPPLPTNSNLMRQSHVSVSPQIQFEEKDYGSTPSITLPQIDVNKLMHQSSAPQSTQIHSEGKIYSLSPRPCPPVPKSSSNGLNNEHSAFPPGFTPNLAFRPCLDPPVIKNAIRPSTWRRKP